MLNPEKAKLMTLHKLRLQVVEKIFIAQSREYD